MRTFQINAMMGESESSFTVQPETAGTFVITQNQKFITRLFKTSDGLWKTQEVTNLSTADINTLGEEIDIYLEKTD